MKILLLEDNLYTAEMIRDDIDLYLCNKKLYAEIILCNSIFEATEALEAHAFDYIITDLNMSPEGLPEEYINETLGAVITGWVWVKHAILNNGKKQPQIIFYTAFAEELLRNDEYKNSYIKEIPLIPKTKNGNNIGELCQTLVDKINMR